MAEQKIQSAPKAEGELKTSEPDEQYEELSAFWDQQHALMRISRDDWLTIRRNISRDQEWPWEKGLKLYLDPVKKALDAFMEPSVKGPRKGGSEREFKNPAPMKTETNQKGEEAVTILDAKAIGHDLLTAYDRIVKYGVIGAYKVPKALSAVEALLGVHSVAYSGKTTARKVMIEYLGYDPKSADQLAEMVDFAVSVAMPMTGLAMGVGKAAQMLALSREGRAALAAENILKAGKAAGMGLGGLPAITGEGALGFPDRTARAFHDFQKYFTATQEKIFRIRERVPISKQGERFESGEIVEVIQSPEIIAGMQKEYRHLAQGLRDKYASIASRGATEDDVIEFMSQGYPIMDAMVEVAGRGASASRQLNQFKASTKNIRDEFNAMFDFFSSLLDIPLHPENIGKSRQLIMERLAPVMEQGGMLEGLMKRIAGHGATKGLKAIMHDLGPIYKLNLVSGPATQFSNVGGGAGTTLLKAAQTSASSFFGRYILRDKSRQPIMETEAMIVGLLGGFLDGVFAFSKGGPKYASTKKALRLTAPDAKLEGSLQDLESGLGKVLGTIAQPLLIGDTILRSGGTRGILLARGIVEGGRQGIPKEDLIQFAQRFAENPPPDVFQEALRVGQEMAATMSLGPLSQMVGRGREWLDQKTLVGGTILIPFLKAVTSMGKTVYNHSPVLSLLSSKTLHQMRSGNVDQIADAGGRIMSAHALSVIAFGLAATGHVTGDGPRDPKLLQQWVGEGWEPRMLHIGGYKVPLHRISPVGDLLALHANVYDLWKTGDLSATDAERLYESVGWLGLKLFSNINPYQGLIDIAGLLTPEMKPDEISTQIGRIAANFVPAAGLARQVVQYTSPEIRRSLDETRGVIESAQASIGGWGGRLRRDIWSRTRKYNIFRQPIEPDKFDKYNEYLNEIGVTGLNPPDDFLKGYEVASDYGSEVVAALRMNPEEADYFAVKKAERFTELFERNLSDTRFRYQSIPIQKQIIESDYAVRAEKLAEADLYGKFPYLKDAVHDYYRTKGEYLQGKIDPKEFKSTLNLRLESAREGASTGAATAYPVPQGALPKGPTQ